MSSSSHHDILARLSEHGVHFAGPSPSPIASYVPCVQTGNLLFVSGQLPRKDGQLIHVGRLGHNVTVEEGQEAAKWCAVNGLHVAHTHLGSLERIKRVVRVGGFVRSSDGFSDQPKVINGASDFLLSILGPEVGKHARAAVGVSELPLGVAVEVEFLFEVE